MKLMKLMVFFGGVPGQNFRSLYLASLGRRHGSGIKVAELSDCQWHRSPRRAEPHASAESLTRNLPHRPVLGLERPLGIGGGPERPRLLQPPLTTPRQLVVVLELGGVVLIQKWPLRGHRRVPLPEERAGQRSLPHSCLLSPRLHRARPGGGACGSHLRGPALRRPQRASGPAALCGQGMVLQARLRGDAGLRAGAVAPLSLEPGGHGARGPTLAGAGAADDGSGLAGRGGAHGQALHQRAGGALRPQPGPRLFHENFQSPGGWGGLQLAPDLHGCRGPHALGPRLRHGAAFQQQLPPGARFHHGGGVYSKVPVFTQGGFGKCLPVACFRSSYTRQQQLRSLLDIFF